MNRAFIYLAEENGPYTYDFDEQLPAYPLPALHDTLQRYFDSLKPFGNEAELKHSKSLLDEFEKGVGAQLQEKLEKRASSMKNWLNEWWEKYGYHSLRMPLQPYTVMGSALRFDVIGIQETPQNALKNFARVIYHTIEHWDLLRHSKIKPMSSNNGKIKYSSALFKRFYSTSRVPGLEYDHLQTYFKPANEGATPTHGMICGKGRIFIFNTVHEDNSILSPQEILVLIQRVRSMIDYEDMGDCVPILTHDERTNWAKNYETLRELSAENKKAIELIQSSNIVAILDENEPKDYEEVSQLVLYGDFHSRWGDRSSIMICYKNGKMACLGEHSSYDGTISVSFMLYVQLSLLEAKEPNWLDVEQEKLVALQEIKLQLNDHLRNEIQRLYKEFQLRGHDVIVGLKVFDDFGKDLMKVYKLHPDSFVQVVMQWTYARLHNEIAPTYETALMRQYYNGRTETLRSCTPIVSEFLMLVLSNKASEKELTKAFRAAVENHNFMMNEARKGHGVDRHLFGLWCIAQEHNIKIPDIFSDPLYAKSGGGGNFVLSTSTLGYTANLGFVAPMLLDGYAVFYSITSNAIFIQTVIFRESKKTSVVRFNDMFQDTFRLARKMLDSSNNNKSNL